MVDPFPDDVSADLRWFLAALARGLLRAGEPAVTRILGRLAGQDLVDAAVVPPQPHPQEVTAYLAPAIAEAVLNQPEVAAALAALSENFHWLPGTGSAGLTQIIGPQGFMAGDGLRLDLVLLAPGVQQHLPVAGGESLWWPLTGPSRFVNGHETTLAPGTVAAAAAGSTPAAVAGRLPLLGLWLSDDKA